jgi:aspartate kinase
LPTLIMKFGGTSVGSPEAIKQAAAIVRKYARRWDGLVVVVSAMRGVTNTLIRCAHTATRGDVTSCQSLIADLQSRHYDTIATLFSDSTERAQLEAMIDAYIAELSAYSRSIHVLGEVTPRGMDTITSLGERMNARLVAAVLRKAGVQCEAVDAMDLIVTDSAFQNAVPLMDETRTKVNVRLGPTLVRRIVPVVTGFIGANSDGVITTLGRGGSDYTAAILGDCLDADEVWTWTDVDGVMTADPRVVPDARAIPEISFSEVSELAYFGANVLHPKTIRPIMARDIPLWVKNTFNPSYPGTRITQALSPVAGKVTAISIIRDLSMVTVEGRGMLGVPGIAARTFSAVAKVGASVLMISQASSEQSICFVIPSGNLGNVSALGKGFLLMQELGLINRLPRIACAQAEKANPLYLSYLSGFETFKPVIAQPTQASAIQIGDPVSYECAVKTLKVFDGVVEQVSEDELANAAARADQTGLYACPHTGVALGALFKLLDKGVIQSHQRVVVISTAHGLKFSHFKVDYHKRDLELVVERYTNPPVELPADYEAVIRAIE